MPQINYATIALAVVIGIFAFLFLSLVISGAQATANLLVYVIIAVVVLGFFIAIGAILIYIFRVKPAVMGKMVKEDKIKAGIMSRSPYVNDLYLHGDKGHQEVCVGHIIGHMQDIHKVDVGADWLELTDEARAKLKKQGIQQLVLTETTFAVKRKGLRNSFTPIETVVAIEKAELVKKQAITKKIKENGKTKTVKEWLTTTDELPNYVQHSELLGDIKLYGVALNKVGENYYLPQYACSTIIDQIQTGEQFRKLSYYIFNEMATTTGKALQANPQHQMELENQKLIPVNKLIPSQLGGGQNP